MISIFRIGWMRYIITIKKGKAVLSRNFNRFREKITYLLKIMQNTIDAVRFFGYNKGKTIGGGR